MSESRKRSSRRVRNNELRENEQSLHASSPVRPGTPRKYTASGSNALEASCYESDGESQDFEDDAMLDEQESAGRKRCGSIPY